MADESLRITAENESLRIAKETLTGASAFVAQLQETYKNYELELKEWDVLVKANLTNPEALNEARRERDSANDRLKESYVRLENARKDLNKAQEDLNKLLNPQASNELLEEVKRIMIDTTSEVKEVKRIMIDTTSEVKEVKRTMMETTSEFREVKQRLETVETKTEKFENYEESSSMVLDSAHGKLELERLAKDKLIINVTGDGDPFWSQEDQDNAIAIVNESVLSSSKPS